MTDQTSTIRNHDLVHTTVAGEVGWHLAQTIKVLRAEATPIDPAMLRIVLHGMAELSGLLVERGSEVSVLPPSLFCDDRVVAEALALWEGRIRLAMTEQRRRKT